MATMIPTPPRTAEASPAGAPAGRPAAAIAVLAALTGAAGYAVFAGGAIRQQDAAWLEAGLVLVALFALAAWLGPRALRPSASPLAAAGVGLLALYAGWVGASLLWTVAPSATWIELNRVLAYVLVVALAIAGASTAPRAVERVALGWLAIATVVALYALGGKVLPGVFDHAEDVTRLRAPFDYTGPLGLVCALAAPVAVRVAVDAWAAPWRRVCALLALFVLLSCLGLTGSPEAVAALVVAIVVVTVVRGPRLTGLAAFALAALAAAPVIAVALTEEALSESGVALGRRIDAGLLFGLVILGAGALLALIARLAIRAEGRRRWTPARNARAWAVLGGLLAALACGGIALAATSEGGVRGALERAGDDLRDVRADEAAPSTRQATGGDRWGWWEEAAGTFAAKPVLGWGGDGFEVSRRLHRATPGETGRAHSVPLQMLSDTGVVGAVLGLGGLLALGVAAALGLRRLAPGRERDLGGALLAATAAWGAHALVVWDWSIPGVTIPALLFLGVLCARRPEARDAAPAAFGVPREESSAGRFAALAVGGLLLCAALTSVVLPAWSEERADTAVELARDRDTKRQEDAAAAARLAARLNPLAVRPLFVAADIDTGRERLLDAREDLLDAVGRQPWSVEAWTRLAEIGLVLADTEGARRAARRAAALDPGDPATVGFARMVQSRLTPPESSATAVGTPLPVAPPVAP